MSDDLPLPTIEDVLSNPASSTWLKSVLIAALQRDAVDAANDAALLAALLDRRADALLSCCRQAASDSGVPAMREDGRVLMAGDRRLMH